MALRGWASNQIGRIVGDLKARGEHQTRKMMFDIAMNLEAKTPKDTHHAASNWVWGSEPRYTPEGSKKSPTYEAFTHGLLSLSQWTFERGSMYLTNAVSYIKDLDEGYSPQAPAGFIGMTIRKVLRLYTNSRFRNIP